VSIEFPNRSLDSAVKLNKTRQPRRMQSGATPHLTGEHVAARHVVAMLGARAIAPGHDQMKGLPMQVRVRRRRRASSLMSSALILTLGVGAECTYASGADAKQPPKGSQTAAQQKISSRLLREIDRARRGEKVERDAASGVAIDTKGRALVEIRCDVTAAIQKTLRAMNATIVSSLPDYRSILAWVPLPRLEELAGLDAVYAIQPAPQATTNRGRR
jgi:hypothetical protein